MLHQELSVIELHGPEKKFNATFFIPMKIKFIMSHTSFQNKTNDPHINRIQPKEIN